MLKRVEAGAAVLMAFEQVGGTEAALNMAKDYSLDRYAFGRQIGSYQAIKHRLADMYVKLELARSNAYYGAMILSEDSAELELAAASARISATEAYRFAAQECIQVHGGIGFTWEANPQFHYRAQNFWHWLWAVPADGKTGSYQSLRKVTWLDAALLVSASI